MKMKKNAKQAYAILSIALVLFCVIAFVIPTAKTASFWIAFAFSIVAFAAQILVWKSALGRDEPLKSKFLGLPLIHIGIVYLIVQLVAFAVFMAVPTLPVWIPIVACALILGTSAICLIAADVGKDEVSRVDEKVQTKVAFIRDLQTKVEMLADAETDKEAKTALNKLVEQIRFSDPISDEALSSIEADIVFKVAELQTRMDIPQVNTISSLLTERNKKCKNLK